MKNFFIIFIIVVLAGFGSLIFFHTNVQNTTNGLHIVAAENFYGDVAKQIGGKYVNVVSILTDPNVDPHEYESSVQDSVAVSNADIVIENGDDYDTWMDKLLSASPSTKRTVLVGFKLAPATLEDNPHVWYGVQNVQAVATKIAIVLSQKDPSHAAYYQQNLITFTHSLQPISQKIQEVKAAYVGTPVGLTETIYLYQTGSMGLNVLTPLPFERAIAEGNDPSARDVAAANDQITKKQVKVLIYNEQTITPITTQLQNEAKTAGIPVVGVTETMPQNLHYQTWMLSELNNLSESLASITK